MLTAGCSSRAAVADVGHRSLSANYAPGDCGSPLKRSCARRLCRRCTPGLRSCLCSTATRLAVTSGRRPRRLLRPPSSQPCRSPCPRSPGPWTPAPAAEFLRRPMYCEQLRGNTGRLQSPLHQPNPSAAMSPTSCGGSAPVPHPRHCASRTRCSDCQAFPPVL